MLVLKNCMSLLCFATLLLYPENSSAEQRKCRDRKELIGEILKFYGQKDKRCKLEDTCDKPKINLSTLEWRWNCSRRKSSLPSPLDDSVVRSTYDGLIVVVMGVDARSEAKKLVDELERGKYRPLLMPAPGGIDKAPLIRVLAVDKQGVYNAEDEKLVAKELKPAELSRACRPSIRIGNEGYRPNTAIVFALQANQPIHHGSPCKNSAWPQDTFKEPRTEVVALRNRAFRDMLNLMLLRIRRLDELYPSKPQSEFKSCKISRQNTSVLIENLPSKCRLTPRSILGRVVDKKQLLRSLGLDFRSYSHIDRRKLERRLDKSKSKSQLVIDELSAVIVDKEERPSLAQVRRDYSGIRWKAIRDVNGIARGREALRALEDRCTKKARWAINEIYKKCKSGIYKKRCSTAEKDAEKMKADCVADLLVSRSRSLKGLRTAGELVPEDVYKLPSCEKEKSQFCRNKAKLSKVSTDLKALREKLKKESEYLSKLNSDIRDIIIKVDRVIESLSSFIKDQYKKNIHEGDFDKCVTNVEGSFRRDSSPREPCRPGNPTCGGVGL